MWYIWKTRNAYLFQYHPIHPLHVMAKTVKAIFEWNVAHLYAGPGSKACLTTDRWLPPPPGWIKMNFDGAFDIHSGKASIGGLARDLNGNLLMAFTSEVRASHPLEAELLALQRELHHLSSLQPTAVQL